MKKYVSAGNYVAVISLLLGCFTGIVFASEVSCNRLEPAYGDLSSRAAAQADCALEIFPPAIRSTQFPRFALILLSGTTFQRGDAVSWGTEDIITLLRFQFNSLILSLVQIEENAVAGDYLVSAGQDNCTGVLTIK